MHDETLFCIVIVAILAWVCAMEIRHEIREQKKLARNQQMKKYIYNNSTTNKKRGQL